MDDELEELYQQVILEHAKRPRNRGEITDGAVKVHGDNPSCGDELDLYVRFGEGGGIEDIKFTGQGCAISQASASLMTGKIKGKTRAEAEATLSDFTAVVTGDTAEGPAHLGDLRLLRGVRKFPQRVKCAMLPWRALQQAISEGAGAVSTE